MQSDRLLRALALLAIFAVSPPLQARAQNDTGEQTALMLRPNVVKISATLKAGSVPQDGFGFIVGQSGNKLVIVTANHVVRGDDPGVEDKAPIITFFQDQGMPVTGALQATALERSLGDLAVILAPRPQRFELTQRSQANLPVGRKNQVWLVGRGGSWDVPVTPGVVSGIGITTGRIRVEGLGVLPGSSGGPLVSKDGIVGMIVSEGTLAAEAVPIALIQRQVQDAWQYPWQIQGSGPPPPTPDILDQFVTKKQRASFDT